MDDPVISQLAAYNAHDVDAFLACYAPDAQIVDGAGRVLMSGAEELRQRYAQLFANHPDVHADIRARLHEGEWVVDHEIVRTGGDEHGYVVAYRVSAGAITRVIILGG